MRKDDFMKVAKNYVYRDYRVDISLKDQIYPNSYTIIFPKLWLAEIFVNAAIFQNLLKEKSEISQVFIMKRISDEKHNIKEMCVLNKWVF